MIDQALAGETIYYSQWLQIPEYGKRYFNVTLSPLTSGEVVLGYVATVHDSTEHELSLQNVLTKEYLVQSSHSALSMCSPEGVVTYVNPSFVLLWGLSYSTEAIGRHVKDFWDEPTEAIEVLSRLRNESKWNGWLKARRVNGETFIANVSAHAVFSPQGELVGYAASFVDDTQRLIDEKNLRDSERKARALLDATTDAYVLLDLDGIVLDSNVEFQKRLSVSAEEILGKVVWNLFPEDVASRRIDVFKEIINSALPLRIEEPRGNIWLDVSYCPIVGDSGKVAMVAVFSHDISAWKNAEEKLVRRTEHFQAILNSSQEAIVLLDDNGVVHRANATFARRCFCSVNEVEGRNLADLFSFEIAHRWLNLASRVFENGENADFIDSHGDVSFEIFARPAETLRGRVKKVVLYIRDISERIVIERRLRSSKKRLALALKAGAVGVWEWNIVSGELYWSSEAEKIFGVASDEFENTYNSFLDFVHPEDREYVVASVEHAVQFISEYSIEHRIVRPDGGIRWVAEIGEVHCDSRGFAERMYGTVRDISMIREQQSQVLWQRTLFQALLNTIHEPAMMLDRDGCILFANGAALDNFVSLSPDIEKKGNPLYVKRFKGFIEDWVMDEVLKTGVPVTIEKSYHAKEYEVKIYPVSTQSGSIDAIGVLCIDMTSQRRSSEKMNLLLSAVEQSFCSVIITDRHGMIEYVNPRHTATTGFTAEESVGKTPAFLKSGEHSESFYKSIWETIPSGKVWKGEMCNRKKDGSIFWEDVSISPVMDDRGTIKHFIAVKVDISDRKDLERLKGDVERIMRHDIKTLLNGLVGFPQVLSMDTNITDDQRESLNIMEDLGRRMLRMTEMSLDIFKMEQGTYVSNPEALDIVAVSNKVIQGLSSQISAKNVQIVLDISEDGERKRIYALAEETLLASILSNLLSNALDASPEGGDIHISFSVSDSVSISIHNMGSVPEQIRCDFFQKYKTYGKFRGTGLGVYSAKLMASALGGDIAMTTSEESGTILTVSLPCPVDGCWSE